MTPVVEVSTIEATIMTAHEAQTWRAFCEWLNARKYKSAYQSDVPAKWRHLIYVGGNPTGQAARECRIEAGLIFYYTGWGWRLRKGWSDRLEELEREASKESKAGRGVPARFR